MVICFWYTNAYIVLIIQKNINKHSGNDKYENIGSD